MRLREEMKQRAIAALEFGPPTPDNPPLSGWIVYSVDWDENTQAAVNSVMSASNALFEMVIRLAESIDELRDALDIQGNEDGG